MVKKEVDYNETINNKLEKNEFKNIRFYNEILKNNERIDDLQYKGLVIIQKKDCFCFGIDAVILSNFVEVKKDQTIIELGTGTGIIAILLAMKTQAKSIIGLEIQEEIAEMAMRSIELNNLSEKVKIVCGDLKECDKNFELSSFDIVVSNPPYIKNGGGIINKHNSKAISRHEILCNLEDVIKVSSKLLKSGGQLVMVHRPSRLADIIWLMRKYNIEPKFMRFVYPSPNKVANLLLIKGNKSGNSELKMLKPLYIHDENGKYSREIDEIYERNRK